MNQGHDIERSAMRSSRLRPRRQETHSTYDQYLERMILHNAPQMVDLFVLQTDIPEMALPEPHLQPPSYLPNSRIAFPLAETSQGVLRRELAPAPIEKFDDATVMDEDSDDNDDESISSYSEQRPPRDRSESMDGYDMRGRYWEAMDVLNRDMSQASAGHTCDPVCLPPSGLKKTPAIYRLGEAPIRRAWKRRRRSEIPDLDKPSAVESIMVYERGELLEDEQCCERCKAGFGIAPDCVIMPVEDRENAIGDGACSNCLYADDGQSCNATGAPANSRSLVLGEEDGYAQYDSTAFLGRDDTAIEEMKGTMGRLKRALEDVDEEESLAVQGQRIAQAAFTS